MADEQPTDGQRDDWEHALVAFLTAPPAPSPKGAKVRRVSRPKSTPSSRCVYGSKT